MCWANISMYWELNWITVVEFTIKANFSSKILSWLTEVSAPLPDRKYPTRETCVLLTVLSITNNIRRDMLQSFDTKTPSPNRTCQPNVWIPGLDLAEGLVDPDFSIRKQGEWKNVRNMVEEDKAWRHQQMGRHHKVNRHYIKGNLWSYRQHRR